MTDCQSRQSVIDLWSACERQLDVNSDMRHIIGQSDPFRRIYINDQTVIKVEFPDQMITSEYRNHDIAGEYEICRKYTHLKDVPKAIRLRQECGFSALYLERVSGQPICLENTSLVKILRTVAKLAVVSFRLGNAGVAHNDIVSSNILVDDSGRLALIDFDQAIETSKRDALLRNYFGISISKQRVYASMFHILRAKVRMLLPPRVLSTLQKVRALITNEKSLRALPNLPVDTSEKSVTLLEAWKLGQISDANAPGAGVAYYGLEFDGTYFPGERPWAQRWNLLRSLVDFRDKKVLELGCNMGLLSSYLLAEGGAKTALGTDVDNTILMSARLVASVLEVDSEFRCVNFDSEEDWESDLLEFKPDIVFALNVLHWLSNKDRFLRFLGQFNCLIFEGHDSFEVEKQRLINVGFEAVEFVSLSERSRPVIICLKGDE
jgi:predicted Ser/Thr protein kinase